MDYYLGSKVNQVWLDDDYVLKRVNDEELGVYYFNHYGALEIIKKLKKMRGVKEMRLIGIYRDNEEELLVNLVNTIEEGALWIGVTPQALYKNHKLHGVMGANGFKLEIINIEEDDDNEL